MQYTAKYPQNRMRLKTEFTSVALRETAQAIRDEQSRTASEWGLFDTGNLEKSLKGHFSVDAQGGGAKLSMRYLAYARFLDIADQRRQRKREGYHLYNRPVFGHLYGQLLPHLRYGFTEDVREEISQRLYAIASTKMPFYKKIDMQIKEISNYNPQVGSLMAKSYRRGY